MSSLAARAQIVQFEQGADPSLPRKLCLEAECPEAVEIPRDYAVEDRCGDFVDLAIDQPDIHWQMWSGNVGWAFSPYWDVDYLGAWRYDVNTGKRPRDGVFKITRVQHKIARSNARNADIWEYTRYGRIEYTFKCKSGIVYRDAYEWNQPDHTCSDYGEDDGRCSESMDSAVDADPARFDPTTLIVAPLIGSRELRLPIHRILEKWRNRRVGWPAYYGGPNTLANPVILVNGLGFDFRTMGAVPLTDPGTPEWRKGYVRDYLQGSLPDVMSRAYGLAKGDEINHNGIYFLNIDPTVNLENLSDADKWSYLDRIVEILLDHAQTLPVTPDLKADIVCHSSGCLLIREALARASARSFPTGLNPADHIRRIVTVNAPHQGTGLAKDDASLAGIPEYKGLPGLIGQITDDNSDRLIASGAVRIDFSDPLEDCSNVWYESASCWLGGQTLDIMDSYTGIALGGSDGILAFPFHIRGSLLGPYTVSNLWALGDQSDKMAQARAALRTQRTKAIEMQNALFPADYVPGRMSEYPRRTNGSYIEILPFYSDNSQSMVPAFAKTIAGKLSENNPCAGKTGTEGKVCRYVRDFLMSGASETLEKALLGEMPRWLPWLSSGENTVYFGNGSLTLSIDPDFVSMLKDLQAGWLKSSDMVVEAKSQKWSLEAARQDPETDLEIRELHRPATYALHYSEVPEGNPRRPVLHTPLVGPLSANELPAPLAALSSGAPLMGRDLFCGLDATCADLLSRSRQPIYAGHAVRRVLPILLPSGVIDTREIYTQTVRLQEDFEIYPQILSGDRSGVAIQDGQGSNLVVVSYDPAVGTWIWIDGPAGGSAEIVLKPDRRPQFLVKRHGQEIEVTLTTQDGNSVVRHLISTSLRDVDFVVLGDGLAATPVALIGNATATDLELELPQLEWGMVRPILQERGNIEANQSRPWLWVVNTSGRTLRNLTISYYFTADPAQEPVVEMDYPLDLAMRKENLGGNLWAFHVALPEVPENAAWPKSGMQVRVHYRNWGEWTKSDDPSVGSEMPMFAEHVVIRDALGRVLWGAPPSAPAAGATTGGITLEATWKDAAQPGETGLIRPDITLKNTSLSTLTKGYKVVLRVGGLGPSSAVPVLDGFYHPDNSGVILREADGTLRLEWTFVAKDLEPGQNVGLGQWALHWAGYEAIIKSDLSYQVIVVDPAGSILFQQGEVGSTPSGTGSAPPSNTVTLASIWKDAASTGETNTIRPDLQIRNLSSQPLGKGYQAILRIAGLPTAEGVPVLEGDWHPDNAGVIAREASGAVRVQWTFGAADLAGLGSISVGQWRIHWPDYHSFDKDQLRYSLQFLDVQGNEILGSHQGL